MASDDISKPIFAYGILRKKSVLKKLLQDYNLNAVRVSPDTIVGYVPYHSDGINFAFPVTQKQKDKYPDGSFKIRGAVIKFIGEVDSIAKVLEHIDQIEYGYTKTLVLTEGGTECYAYIMSNNMKQYLNIYGLGLVMYPDSITIDTSLYPDQTEQKLLTFTTDNTEIHPMRRFDGCTYDYSRDYIG